MNAGHSPRAALLRELAFWRASLALDERGAAACRRKLADVEARLAALDGAEPARRRA